MIIHKPILICTVELVPTVTPTLITEGYPVSPFRALTFLFHDVGGGPYSGANQIVRAYFWNEIPGTLVTGWFANRWFVFASTGDLQIVSATNNVLDAILPRDVHRLALKNETNTASVYVSIFGWTDRKEQHARRP